MKSVFGRGFFQTNKKSDKLFYVNNCGFYQNINTDMNIIRHQGRYDYQIIYVSAGCIYSGIKKNLRYAAGSIIIFKPGEPQIYSIKKEDNTSYFWIHFSGTYAEAMLSELNIIKQTYMLPQFYEFCILCRDSVHECSAPRPNEILISSYVCTALSLISKKISGHHNRFAPAIESILADENLTTAELAEKCGLSVYHFIRAFKQEYNLTPHAYIIRYKIEKSKYFLINDDIDIKKAAELSGFSDPLYFSRVFKKLTGISPREYKKNCTFTM